MGEQAVGGEESPMGVMAGYASLGSLLLLYGRGLTGSVEGGRGWSSPRHGGTAGPAVNSFPADLLQEALHDAGILHSSRRTSAGYRRT